MECFLIRDKLIEKKIHLVGLFSHGLVDCCIINCVGLLVTKCHRHP